MRAALIRRSGGVAGSLMTFSRNSSGDMVEPRVPSAPGGFGLATNLILPLLPCPG